MNSPIPRRWNETRNGNSFGAVMTPPTILESSGDKFTRLGAPLIQKNDIINVSHLKVCFYYQGHL
jgi:hypothetical protein